MAYLSAQWRKAFAQQADSDKQVYEVLCKVPGLPVCHRLHYLQMFLEKLCKANIPLGSTHNVVAKVLPNLLRDFWRRHHKKGVVRDMKELRRICEEIDYLTPAVNDGGRRKDNVEYPWETTDSSGPIVLAPCKGDFRLDQRLRSSVGRELLKGALGLCGETIAKG